jgi:Fe2+ transport system protein B
MLIGNKCDMNDKRQVTKERGEKLAIEYGMKCMETSAKQNENIENAFFTLARDIKIKTERRQNVILFYLFLFYEFENTWFSDPTSRGSECRQSSYRIF